jgi:hypothetical protein
MTSLMVGRTELWESTLTCNFRWIYPRFIIDGVGVDFKIKSTCAVLSLDRGGASSKRKMR